MRLSIVALAVSCSLVTAAAAEAQSREVTVRAFADVGSTTFTAAESFTAVLGSERGVVFGGGADLVLPQGMFVALRASRFRKVGERVFVFEGETFKLGIPTTVTVTPVELSGGYRFRHGARLVPYVGGGIGWHYYKETSEFADPSENVDDRHLGYQAFGGAEIRLARWIGAAAEAQWTGVPDAIGGDPNSLAAEFDESDLGGVTVRVKIVIGR